MLEYSVRTDHKRIEVAFAHVELNAELFNQFILLNSLGYVIIKMSAERCVLLILVSKMANKNELRVGFIYTFWYSLSSTSSILEYGF